MQKRQMEALKVEWNPLKDHGEELMTVQYSLPSTTTGSGGDRASPWKYAHSLFVELGVLVGQEERSGDGRMVDDGTPTSGQEVSDLTRIIARSRLPIALGTQFISSPSKSAL